MILRFLVGLAAAVYTLQAAGVFGLIALGLLAAFVIVIFLVYWPIILVGGIILGTWLIARSLLRRQHV